MSFLSKKSFCIVFQIITFGIVSTEVFTAKVTVRKRDPFPFPSSASEITLPRGIVGLSNHLLQTHLELTRMYFSELAFIRNELSALGNQDRLSRQYSQTRELKLEDSDKRNAYLYHMLYFGNLGGTAGGRRSTPGTETEKYIKMSFGSFETFRQIFMLLGNSARGWMTVCLPIEEKQLRFFIADSHNTSTPLLAFPILVIDLYEHAFLPDYTGAGSMQQYLGAMYNQLDWDVIEERLVRSLKAVDILRMPTEPALPIGSGDSESTESNSEKK